MGETPSDTRPGDVAVALTLRRTGHVEQLVGRDARAEWVEPGFELPLAPDADPPYSETYQMALWSPSSHVGVWWHLTYATLGVAGLWEQQFTLAFPGDRYLLCKTFNEGVRHGQRLSVGGLTVSIDKPLDAWSLVYRGAGRVVSGAEMRAGSLVDGPHVPFTADLRLHAMSPPYDFGTHRLGNDSADAVSDIPAMSAKGHYEQDCLVTGRLTVGDDDINIDGTCMRTRSWGTREYRGFGTSIYVHGQFRQSGRSFMAIRLQPPGGPGFTSVVVGEPGRVTVGDAQGLPLAATVDETESDYEFELTTAASTSVVRAEVLAAVRMTFVQRAETCMGSQRSAETHHDFVQAFTKFSWDGETGYGVTERAVDLQ